MINLYDELVALVRAFDAAGVEYALCGGMALAVHGVSRATRDIDLLALPEQELALREVVRAQGYTLEALPMTFTSGIRVKRFTKLVEGRPVLLDVLWVNDALREIWAEREHARWEHGPLEVVSRRGLITLKLTAGRPQDLADIQALSALERSDGSA